MTDWLVDTLVATSALMALVLLLREPVRRRCGAGVAYALWLIPALRVVTPSITETVERAAPAVTPAAFDLVAGPVVLAEPRLMASTAPVSLYENMGGWPTLVLALWGAIAATLILHGIRTYVRQRRAILAEAVGLTRVGRVRLVRSPAVSGPVAFGLLDPVIAVPDHFERHFTDRERRLALDHELAHHQSGDLVANAIAFVLLCLQWFNPLAWLSYAAFRFDQEAACDARVLDKADPADREPYGRAIAKAASGRAMLFAAALDRPHTLHRRLKSMLNTPTSRARAFGRMAIVGLVAAALPLTASRAIDYVDVPAPPAPPVAPVAPVAVAPPAPVAPVVAAAALVHPAPLPPQGPAAVPAPPAPPAPPAVPHLSHRSATVHINGRTVRWEDLTAEERAEIREDLREAKKEIAKSHVEMKRDLAEAHREMEKFRNGEFEREMAEMRAELAASLRDIDVHAADLRRVGVDPEQIRSQVRASLREAGRARVAHQRDAHALPDRRAVDAALHEAQKEIDHALDRVDQLDHD